MGEKKSEVWNLRVNVKTKALHIPPMHLFNSDDNIAGEVMVSLLLFYIQKTGD